MFEIIIVLNIIVAVVFLVSGIDDLFIDLYYWGRQLYRSLFVRRKIRPIPQSEMSSIPQKWAAIWIPAWQESEVIDRMLLNTLETFEYRNYDIFVGTYPNDEATQLAVESVRERYRQVRKIVCPHPGPTNKADCLNWVFQGMLLAEQEKGIRYEIVVMHDCEDIVHPLELKLFNWLIPRKDMVQIPVVPLEVPASYITAGTYLDEFAENHTKDMVVRERLCKIVPSAGVGTAFGRDLLDELARARNNQLFNINSLTEDYEFAFGLLPLKRRGIIARFETSRSEIVSRGIFKKREELRQVRDTVAVREYFPDRFSLAVKQKSRWILGISIQGWKNLGWQGGFWNCYVLYRDRKALFTNLATAFGYVVAACWIANLLMYWPGEAPSIVRHGWVWNVIIADTALMANRFLQRVIAVGRVAGAKQALLAIPRTVVGNAINFCATFRAIKQYCVATLTGRKIAWAKTAHAFPSAKQLREHRRRLGDLLLENRLVNVAQLREALQAQEASGQKLGQVLKSLGYVSEKDLLAVIALQLGVPALAIDDRAIDPAWLAKLPRRVAEDTLSLPLKMSDGVMEVVCANPALPGLQTQLEAYFGCPVRLGIGEENDIILAIEQSYMRAEGKSGTLLGQLLVAAGSIRQEELDWALRKQRQSGQKLGEVLQDAGLISASSLAQALRHQAEPELAGVKG